MRAALPLVIPTALIGASFGVAAVTTGWGTLAPIVMSAIVFSGAAQFAVLAVLSAGGSVVTAIVAATLIASRFLAIGVALRPPLRGGPGGGGGGGGGGGRGPAPPPGAGGGGVG